jgi:hypothetical protein
MKQRKINVMVVDEDESFACALERLLRASGFAVQTLINPLNIADRPRPAPI